MPIECNDGKKATYICMKCGFICKECSTQDCKDHIKIELNQEISNFFSLIQTENELKIDLYGVNSFQEYINNELQKKRNVIVKMDAENKMKIRKGKLLNMKGIDIEKIQSLIEKKIKCDAITHFKTANEYLSKLSISLERRNRQPLYYTTAL
jgi:hypothetical protein